MKPNTFYFDFDDLTGIRLTLCPGTDEGKFSEFELLQKYLDLCIIAENSLTQWADDARHGRPFRRIFDLPERLHERTPHTFENMDFLHAGQEEKNMNAKRAAKLIKIANYYGQERQVCKLMEELGEATSAASEVLMLLSYHEQGGKKRDLTARLEHLAGELADVVNVTEQIIQLFGLETDFKVARHAGIQKTLKRIREEEQANETRNEPARRNL